jgi:signal transduction histidine kinase
VELALKTLPEAKQWQVSVRDTGLGIPPHAQEYIFDEFRQVDGSMRRMYGGTGLGLAICRNLCRLMGGNIRVQSALGQGSTFIVTLPMITSAEKTEEPTPLNQSTPIKEA